MPAAGVVAREADLIATQRVSGSGVIVDPAGSFIVTNAHVVTGAQRLRVDIPLPISRGSILAARSRRVEASLVAVDLETDLAVIKIGAPNLRRFAFRRFRRLRAGQLVLAFGSPLGLDNSASLGIVSAVARQLVPRPTGWTGRGAR